MSNTMTTANDVRTQVFEKKQFKDYPDVLDVQQTADLLSVCKNTVYKLIKDQALPCRRIGSAIRIRKMDLIHFVETVSH